MNNTEIEVVCITDSDKEKIKKDLGLRFNTNKIEFTALSFSAIAALAAHATKGTIKYPNDPETNMVNWMKGQKYSTVLNSLLRHLTAFMCGENEEYDDKTNMTNSHLAAVMWNAMVLLHFEINKDKYEQLHLDDRPNTWQYSTKINT